MGLAQIPASGTLPADMRVSLRRPSSAASLAPVCASSSQIPQLLLREGAEDMPPESYRLRIMG